LEIQDNRKPTATAPQGPPSRSMITYLTWAVGALILVVGGMIVLSVTSEPPAPRTSAERDLAKYEELVKDKPRNAAAQAGMGAALMQTGSYKRAIEHLDKAVKLDPRSDYYVVLAETHVALGDTELAIRDLKKAQKSDEGYDRAWYLEGKIYFDQGDYAKAIGPLNRTLELEPGASDVHYLLGQALENLGKREAAIDSYREALKFLPDYKEALDALEKLGAKNVESQTTGDAH